MKGFKAFNHNWTSRLGFQYEVGKKYELPEGSELKICSCGFHFCKNLLDVFGYYGPINDGDISYTIEKVRVAEIEALGEIQQDGTKFCTDKILIVREITPGEIIAAVKDSNCANTGRYNSGHYNTGHYNSGNCNSGDYNSGNCNTGHGNTGDYNTGNRNTGLCNSGNNNSGDCNSGNWNTGYYNTGDHNSGDWNTGYYNTGDFNTGDYNKADFCPGIFNTVRPKMWAFNRQCNVTYTEFLKGLDYSYSRLLDAISCKKIDDDDIKNIKELPNFDPEIFKEITGIDLT